MIRRALAAVAVAALATPAGAAVLYKSVDTNGVVQFSDLPPERGVEAKKIIVPETSSAVPGASRSPDVVATAPRSTQEQALASDDAVQRASMQVDMAEHALAVARRPLWDVADPMNLAGPRMTSADRDRVAYYRKNVKVAQQQLAELLRTRQRAEATMTAEAGAPIYGPSSPIYRR
jgi:H2-forming N5,N10-methylenetetrahydromethanopterin dehydrogenase-like enzyme